MFKKDVQSINPNCIFLAITPEDTAICKVQKEDTTYRACREVEKRSLQDS